MGFGGLYRRQPPIRARTEAHALMAGVVFSIAFDARTELVGLLITGFQRAENPADSMRN